MNLYGYLIVIMTFLSIVMGQQRFIGHRSKSKFRPRPEWFGELLPKPEQIVYDERPVITFDPNNSPFQDFFLEDYDTSETSPGDESGKFPRKTKETEVFQNICPSNRKVVIVHQDPRFDQSYEYKPSKFEEIYCTNPYTGKPNAYSSSRTVNRVCQNQWKGRCIQTNTTLHFVKRLRVAPGEINENCWEPHSLMIYNNCECMWSKHLLGDILHAHINLDDE